jgi:perosamine synthetase
MTVSWFMYVVRLEAGRDRDDVARTLARRGIPTRPYFWPIHLQPAYRERFGFERGAYPHAEAAGDSVLAIPFHGGITADDVDRVCDALQQVVSRTEAVR